MKEVKTINSREARAVYGSDALSFVRKALEQHCHFSLPESPSETHKQSKRNEYTDELRIYGKVGEKGVNYRLHIQVASQEDQVSFSKISIQTFGFDQLSLRFDISTRDGLHFEVETEDKTILTHILDDFEATFGYCRA
ncbi:MAG: hypothetical protein GF308_20355 [Candidatus Heimdallarchaeota archaeon]|nr:hypothetical protein [Candidatus Heimdallarchaeota archaeon]